MSDDRRRRKPLGASKAGLGVSSGDKPFQDPRTYSSSDQRRVHSSNSSSSLSSTSKTSGFSRPLSLTPCRVHWWKWVLLFMIFLLLFYFVPSPIDPVVVTLPPYEGREPNTELRRARRLFEGEIKGPEAFVVDKDGNMYTGLGDGRVVRFTDQELETIARLGSPPYDSCGRETTTEESRCGRPLGMAIDSSTAPYHLYIVDSYHGIWLLDLKTKELKMVLNTSLPWDGVPPMRLVNSLALMSNGSFIITDSSSKFDRANLLLDLCEGTCNGKLLHFSPSNDGGSLSVVMDNLCFPNGACLSPSEDFILVAETTRARILRYHLSGSKAGTSDIFAENMVGLPDNISPASSGGYWVAMAASRHSGLIDMLNRNPWIRSLVAKLRLTKIITHMIAPKTGVIVRLSAEGTVEQVLWDEGGKVISEVSGVLDMGDRLYLGSYTAPYLGQLDLT